MSGAFTLFCREYKRGNESFRFNFVRQKVAACFAPRLGLPLALIPLNTTRFLAFSTHLTRLRYLRYFRTCNIYPRLGQPLPVREEEVLSLKANFSSLEFIPTREINIPTSEQLRDTLRQWRNLLRSSKINSRNSSNIVKDKCFPDHRFQDSVQESLNLLIISRNKNCVYPIHPFYTNEKCIDKSR